MRKIEVRVGSLISLDDEPLEIVDYYMMNGKRIFVMQHTLYDLNNCITMTFKEFKRLSSLFRIKVTKF